MILTKAVYELKTSGHTLKAIIYINDVDGEIAVTFYADDLYSHVDVFPVLQDANIAAQKWTSVDYTGY